MENKIFKCPNCDKETKYDGVIEFKNKKFHKWTCDECLPFILEEHYE